MRKGLLWAGLLCTWACTTGADTEDTDDPQGEDCEPSTWYFDQDLDGYGAEDMSYEACEPSVDTHLAVGGDCNDQHPQVHPGAAERCNEQDDDCDGLVDEEPTDAPTWYPDADEDGWGEEGAGRVSCEAEQGHIPDGGDCDDGDPDVNPEATEVCNGVDDDCSGAVDDGAVGTVRYYPDSDGDGWGGDDGAQDLCEDPGEGWLTTGGDCEDSLSWVNPDVTSDPCNGFDDDCDGLLEEDHEVGWQLITVAKDGWIYEIDPATAEATQRVQTDTPNVSSTDVREDGTGFMVDGTYLYEFDGCTGDWTIVGEHDLSQIGSLGFDATGGLYGLDSGRDVLLELDTSDASSSVVGSLGTNIGFNGFGYDCATDTMYAVDKTSAELFEVDLTTGLASNFQPLGLSFGVVGMEFDTSRGLIWVSVGGQLYEVDPATGATTEVGDFGISDVNDLSLYPSCP